MTDEAQVTAAPEAVQQEVQAPKWAPETEQEAKALGWKSPDEWKGDVPSGYIDDPTKYLERAESFTPFRKIKERMTEIERKADERLRKMESVQEKAFERKLAEIQAAKLEAVEVGDVEKFKALETQQSELQQPAKQSDDAPHIAEIERWTVGKDWFKTDPIMTQAAATLYGEAQRKGLTDPKAILAEVDRRMAETFPHKFGAKPVVPQRGADVEPGLTFGGQSADPFSKLPADAKAAFARYVEKGLFKDDKEGRAAYVKDYNDA